MNVTQLKERIQSVDVQTIKNMSPAVLAKLTDIFKEPLVKEIMYKVKTNSQQRELLTLVEEAYEKWMEENEPLWGTPAFGEKYPEYMNQLQFDIECGMIVTKDGTITEPKTDMVPADTTTQVLNTISSVSRPTDHLRKPYTMSKARLKRFNALDLISTSVEEIIEKKMNDYMQALSFNDIDVACPDSDNETNGLVKILQERVRELEQETLDLQAEIDRLKELSEAEEPVEDIAWHDKVRLDLLLRLMEKDGANLSRHGNKTKAAKVMNMITKLPLQTCKNYCSDPRLNTEKHKEEILRTNTNLQALEMGIRL